MILSAVCIAVCAFVALVALIAVPISYYKRFDKRFKKVRENMTYSEVVEIMGNPSEVHEVGSSKTCVWDNNMLCGFPDYRTVFFKNGIAEKLDD
jgi:hypothetical protein